MDIADLFSRLEPKANVLEQTSAALQTRFKPGEVAHQWNVAFVTSGSTEKRLAIVYLANEVFQSSRKNNQGAFIDPLLRPVMEAFATLGREKPEYLPKLERVIQVWQERSVLSASDLEALRGALRRPPQASPQASPREGGLKRKRPSSPFKPAPPAAAAAMQPASPAAEPDVRPARHASGAQSVPQRVQLINQLLASVDAPDAYADLFADMDAVEHDSISDELLAEKFNASLTAFYKAIKTTAKDVPELAATQAALSRLPAAQAVDEEEARGLAEDVDEELFDKVEGTHRVCVDLAKFQQHFERNAPKVEKTILHREHIQAGLLAALERSADPLQPPAIEHATELLAQLQAAGAALADLARKLQSARQEALHDAGALRRKAEELLAQSSAFAGASQPWSGAAGGAAAAPPWMPPAAMPPQWPPAYAAAQPPLPTWGMARAAPMPPPVAGTWQAPGYSAGAGSFVQQQQQPAAGPWGGQGPAGQMTWGVPPNPFQPVQVLRPRGPQSPPSSAPRGL
jgi:hypothetical protein